MATTTKPRTPNGVTSKTAKPKGTALATKAKAPTVDGSPIKCQEHLALPSFW